MQREVVRLGRCVEKLGLSVRDYTGRSYGNLNVDAVAIEADPEVDSEVIFETIAPEIAYQGAVIQKSRVIVHKPSSDSSVRQVSISTKSSTVALSQREENQKPDKSAEKSSAFRTADSDSSWSNAPSRSSLLYFVSTALIAILCALTLYALSVFASDASIRLDRGSEQLQVIESKVDAYLQKEQQAPHDDTYDVGVSADTVRLIAREVKAGDTLQGICELYGIDFQSYVRFICAINNLDSPDSIFIGDTLFLPMIQKGENHAE